MKTTITNSTALQDAWTEEAKATRPSREEIHRMAIAAGCKTFGELHAWTHANFPPVEMEEGEPCPPEPVDLEEGEPAPVCGYCNDPSHTEEECEREHN